MAQTANGVPYAAASEDVGDYPVTSQALAELLDPTFTNVTFNGSWTNFGAPYEEVSYAKVGSIIRLRGLAKHATAGTTGTVFTLPSGYRPAKQRHFVVGAGPGLAIITITSAGVVAIASYISSGTAANVEFDPISFDLGA